MSSISPRARCSSASNARWPIRSDVASASSRIGEGAVDVAGAGFGFGKRNLEEPVEDQRRSARAEVRRRDAWPRARRRPCRFEQLAKPSRKTPNARHNGQIVLTRESGEFDGVQRGAREVAAHEFEHGRVRFSRVRACRHGRGLRSAPRRRRRGKPRARCRPAATM